MRGRLRLRWQLLATHVPADGALGGMVRYVTELAAALDRHPEVELSLLTGAEAAAYFRGLLGDSRRVHVVPRLPTLGRAALERFTGCVHAGGPYDVVHGTKHLLPRRSSAVRVLTVHDMILFDRPGDFAPAKRWLLRRPYLGSLADADLLLCVSAATQRSLVGRLPSAADRSVVVPLAVSGTLLGAQPQSVPELVGREFALIVGDDSARKNLPLVVDSWERVCQALPAATLAVVGPASWTASSRGRAFERLKAEGKIVALGRASDATLRWCYEQARVVLCPSLVEGFGLPAAEALAFGAPLVTSTDPALVEVSGERAAHVAADRPQAWTRAIIAGMSTTGRSKVGGWTRTWDQVADDTVRAVRRASERLRESTRT